MFADCSSLDDGGQGRSYVGFRAVYVFDIGQTEGKELPSLTEVQGDVSGFRERLFEFVQSQGVELNYSERIAPAKGLSHGGKITLLSGMSQPRNSQRWFTRLLTKCYIAATAAPSPRSRYAKPRPNPWRS